MNLGNLLRHHRQEAGLTLKAVAHKAGISEGFLSQVENNVKSPSVETLINICAALKVNTGDVINQASNHKRLFVVRKEEWEEVELPHTGFATIRFCPPAERSVIDSAILFMEPGREIPVRRDIKNGQELLCVLKGQVEFIHPEDGVTLREGDSVHVWSEPKGQKVVNQGPGQAVVLWVGTI